jgi:hypothetical protein
MKLHAKPVQLVLSQLELELEQKQDVPSVGRVHTGTPQRGRLAYNVTKGHSLAQLEGPSVLFAQ